MLEAAEDSWRAINVFRPVALVRTCVTLKKGLLVEQAANGTATDPQKAAV